MQTKTVEPLIEGGAQVQQVVNIECLADFIDAPLLNIKFRYCGQTPYLMHLRVINTYLHIYTFVLSNLH